MKKNNEEYKSNSYDLNIVNKELNSKNQTNEKKNLDNGNSTNNAPQPITLKDIDFSKLKLPNDAKEKLEDIKKKLERFQKEVLDKFDKYIMGISLLPPRDMNKNAIPGFADLKFPIPTYNQQQVNMTQNRNMFFPQPPVTGLPAQQNFPTEIGQISSPAINQQNLGLINLPQNQQNNQQINKDEIRTLVLIDDSDSQKMSKFELKAKLSQIIIGIANSIDRNIWVEILLLSELWEDCYDGKYEFLNLISLGTPVFDRGMLAAIKISEIHKQMVIKKFEKYIVCYVLAGSLVQGKATKDSDIDVFLVIDDTDVKRMTKFELKEKLRAIIIGMGLEAGEITGIRNKINIQVYILTDFWENIKEANPIIFTFLRDGIPLYDRGIFMPWKLLLKQGKIKPSQEAIDIFMQSGDQLMKTVDFKLKTIGMEDTFYAILTPSQAALMMYGIAPPTPKETPEIMKEIFVKKEKLLEQEYIDILEKNIKIRKDLEHGSKKDISGKEIDELVENAKKYLKRIEKLFKQIEKVKEEENLIHAYETTITLIKDILKLEGIEKIKEKDMLEIFESGLIDTGKIPHKYYRELKELLKAKEDYNLGKLTKTDLAKVNKSSKEFQNFLIDYITKKKSLDFESVRLKVKYGEKYGEMIFLEKTAIIIYDIDSKENKKIMKADINEYTLENLNEINLEEYEKLIAESKVRDSVYLKNKFLYRLSEIFGEDVELVIKN